MRDSATFACFRRGVTPPFLCFINHITWQLYCKTCRAEAGPERPPRPPAAVLALPPKLSPAAGDEREKNWNSNKRNWLASNNALTPPGIAGKKEWEEDAIREGWGRREGEIGEDI